MVWSDVQQQLLLVMSFAIAILVAPFFFVLIDMWSGIRKSIQRGEVIRSNKMQRTVQKLSRYYAMCLSMFVIDLIQISAFVIMHLCNGWTMFTFPIFTLFSVLFVATIEVKSIYEPADQKESRDVQDASKLIKAIIKNHNDPEKIAKEIVKHLTEAQNA